MNKGFVPKNIEEAIEIVEKFNLKNKFRDGGLTNNAIQMLIDFAKSNNNSIDLDNLKRKLAIKNIVIKLLADEYVKNIKERKEKMVYFHPKKKEFVKISSSKKLIDISYEVANDLYDFKNN